MAQTNHAWNTAMDACLLCFGHFCCQHQFLINFHCKEWLYGALKSISFNWKVLIICPVSIATGMSRVLFTASEVLWRLSRQDACQKELFPIKTTCAARAQITVTHYKRLFMERYFCILFTTNIEMRKQGSCLDDSCRNHLVKSSPVALDATMFFYSWNYCYTAFVPFCWQIEGETFRKWDHTSTMKRICNTRTQNQSGLFSY